MGLSRALDSEKDDRRQSWISGSPLFNSFFSSSPPTNSVQRSHSLKEQANQRHVGTARQQSMAIDRTMPRSGKGHERTTPKKPSTLVSILQKAKHRHHRRSVVLDSVMAPKPDLHLQVELLEDDDYEADKSQLKNDFMNLAFTEEFRSTVDFRKLKQGRILDVGCGSGAWCIEMAQKYPNIQVTGIDYESWYQEANVTPPNCHLIHGNILDSLRDQFEPHTFDFIHIRLVALVLTSGQYELASRYCWNLLKPGATMELLEVDMEMCSVGPVTRKMNQQVIHVADHLGFQINVATRLAAFAPWDDCLNLQEKYQSLPIGVWGGRLGVLFRDDLIDILRRCQASVARHYARPKDDKAFLSDLAVACREMEQFHTYANFHFLTVNKRPNM